MYDDKWPLLIVKGEPVTQAQAEQIIIRTDSLLLCSGDKKWDDEAYSIITGTENPWSLPTVEGRLAALRKEMAARRKYGIMHLSYLSQDRVSKSSIGSPGGWCDWRGTLGSCSYTIGKWPGEDDITSDWEQIAEAFPFLNLVSQVASLGEGPPKVWGKWTVREGSVTFEDDDKMLPSSPPWMRGRPLDLDVLRGVVERVRAATPALNLGVRIRE